MRVMFCAITATVMFAMSYLAMNYARPLPFPVAVFAMVTGFLAIAAIMAAFRSPQQPDRPWR